MDLIINQVMQLHVVHETDGRRVIEILAGSAILELNLAIRCDRNALPLCSVITVIRQILHDLRLHTVLVLCLELFPGVVCVGIGHLQKIRDVIVGGTIEVRGRDIKAENLCSQRQMQLQDLSDVHSGRHAQGVQNDIERTSVRKIRHILDGQHAGNDTLVSVTACHLVADRDLSLLCNVDADSLDNTGSQLIAGLSCEDLGIHNDTVLTVRHLERGITDLTCLFTEDGTQKSLLSRQLGLALRGDLADQDITGTDLRTDADDTVLVEILQGILTDTGDITGDLLVAKFGISCLALELLDVDRGVDIFLDETLGKQDGVLVVVTFPAHESDKRILAESQNTVLGRCAVGDDIAGLHAVARIDDGLLVVAVGLVGTKVLDEVDILCRAVVIAHRDHRRIDESHDAVLLGDHADTGVACRLLLHAGADNRSLGRNERDALALHVGAHQCTVCIIVLQERDKARSDREDHSRRHVHVVEGLDRIRGCLVAETSGCIFALDVAVLIELGRCLCDVVVILFVSCHVHDLIRDTGSVRVGLVDLAVRSLDESVLVDLCIRSQRVDQTDVRAFRCLNRAHPSIVRVMDIADLESGAVTGQTAGTQRRETSLVRDLRQRVVLVHELRQLGASEEFLHGSLHRLDIDQRLRRNLLVRIMCRHALADHPLQPRQTDAVLVLQELSNRTDAAVPQVVNVIVVSDAIFQMHVIVHGGKDILLGDVLGNELMYALLQRIRQCLRVLVVLVFDQDIAESRIINLLVNAKLLRIAVHKVGDIHHQIVQDLDVALLCLNHDIRNGRVLNGVRHLARHRLPGAAQDLSVCLIHHILGKDMPGDTVAEGKLLIKFIASNLRQIIAARVKQHCVDQTVCRIHRQRLAGTNLFIQLEQTFLIIAGRVLRKGSLEFRLVAEHIDDLFVRTKTQGAEKHRHRHLSGAVHTNPEHIIGIRLILQPCAAVRNHRAGIHLLSEFVMVDPIVNTGRTDQL